MKNQKFSAEFQETLEELAITYSEGEIIKLLVNAIKDANRRKEYNSREEVKTKRKEYNKKRNAEIKCMRALLKNNPELLKG